jgi:fatty-acyl-CoA synthase
MLSLSTRPHYHTLLDAAVLQPGDQTAIIYLQTGQSPIHVTRYDFCQAVFAYAAGLQINAIHPGDLVIIAHTQNLDSIYAFWGAIVAGAIPSMFPTLTEKLDPTLYLASMAELARLSHVRAILTTADFAPHLRPHIPCPVYTTEELLPQSTQRAQREEKELRGTQGNSGELNSSPFHVSRFTFHASHSSSSPNPLIPASSIAFLQHSSGTTGLQKGVALSHTAVLNQLASYSDAIALNQQDVIVSWLPLYHDMGLIAGFLLPLFQGIPLVLMSPFDWVQHPALLFRAIHDHQGTLCWLPNFAYNHCARRIRQRDLEGLSAASMRLFINCSEPVYHESHQLFLERFAPLGVRPEMLGVSYAMAENTFAVTQTPPGRPARLDIVDRHALEAERRARPAAPDAPQANIRVSCGPPISGTAVRVLDDTGQPLPDRHVGEITIHSDCLFTGYYQRPDLHPFQDGYYHTGDMGYLADGEIYIAGRAKDLIIHAGKNVYPQDIEAIANTVPGVHPGRAVAFGVPDEREGTELIAIVAEVNTEDPAERKQITAALRQAIARQSQAAVAYIHLVGPHWLIKTSSGKIARRANRDKWLTERDRAN